MIIVFGFNVYLNEIEDVFIIYFSVMEVVVVGKFDEKIGEWVCVFIIVLSDVLI